MTSGAAPARPPRSVFTRRAPRLDSVANQLLRAARAIPLARLLAAAQVLLLARRHWHRLEPIERRRLIALVRQGRGRGRNLSPAERDELARLIAKADPRLFAGLVVQRFSPVPLPRRLVRGRR
jgi:hypothetical protein